MARQQLTTEQILSILRETPSRLAALTRGATERQLATPPEPAEWSALEVLAHLRSCADVWGDGIATITAGNHPTIRTVSPTTWVKSTNYCEIGFAASLRAYSDQRDLLLGLLEHLDAAGWRKSATVLGGGSPIEWTVHHYADRLARHERSHLRQVEKTIKSAAVRTA